MTRKTNLGSTSLKKRLGELAKSAWQYPVSISRYGAPWVWIVSHGMWMKRIGLSGTVPDHHPLLKLRDHVDEVLYRHAAFLKRTAAAGGVGLLPNYLMRAMALQAVYGIEDAAMLHERIGYNLLFRRFVGLEADYPDLDPFLHDLAALRRAEGVITLLEHALVHGPLAEIAKHAGISVDLALLRTWREQPGSIAAAENDNPKEPS
ncbi:transposase [Bordetella genomosp. 13]|uniref:transposase n=1 Tax=Bordetella genomosp. 13 TaxID=463040 RepID=UPI0011A55CDA|nr:transposase [Bordetella genomosp. 13]